MILVDSSVWIDYFHGKESAHTDKLDHSLDAGTVLIGDVIMLELLQGLKLDRDYQQVKKLLGDLEQVALLGPERVVDCAQNYRRLRRSGITVRQTTDVVIASFCIANRLPLLFQDKDFNPFVKQLGLRSAL